MRQEPSHLEIGVALKRVPVLLVVAIGVAHGVGVLALNQGPRLCLIIGPGLYLHVQMEYPEKEYWGGTFQHSQNTATQTNI